ncbi:efflux RND transporter periplasmic adaptor subunit [Bacillota bacterium LX-D]|nr:efflux RND transporter periplasmic adaptor subunit [Bacillota bacterium LX-D]
MKKVTTLICVFLLIMGTLTGCGKKQETIEESLLPVETVSAANKDLVQTLETSGEIKALTEVSVAPKVGGKIKALYVKVGDKVHAGQVLFELEATDAQNAVKQAEAAVAVNQANLLKAQRGVIDAKLNYSRSKELYENQALSKAEYDQAESQLLNAQASLKMAEAQVAQSQAAVNSAQDSYQNAIVTAPGSGVVAAVDAEVGEITSSQAAPIKIVQIAETKVQVNVSENVISAMKVGTKVPVTVESLNKKITGTIISVAPQADESTHAFAVEIKLPNQDGKLKPGMIARLTLQTGVIKGALVLPTDALLERDGMNYVFLLEKGKAKEISVKVGMSSGKLTEIKQGLKKGQTVIVKGNRLVADGQKVKVVKQNGGNS